MLLILLVTIEPLLVLIEYVPYGDLLGFLRKSRGLNDTYFKDPAMKPQTNLTAEQLMKFAWQVADGMCYLSSKKVCFVSSSETQGQIVGTRESLKGRKNIYGTKKSKERREEPLGTMSPLSAPGSPRMALNVI